MIYARIAARLFNTPLMVHPGKAEAIVTGLGGRVMGTLDDRVGRRLDQRHRRAYSMVDGVAVIPIEGTLIHKGGWIESDSGETSYQGLQAQVVRAARDTAVKGIVFEVDSFGGEVSGAFETADMIHTLSRAKPTMAILTDHAYSAGYLMASAARQIVLPEEGGAGSIGVIAVHTDMSRKIEAEGLKVTILASGRHKADGNPYEPLPDAVAAGFMAEIDACRRTFAGRVAQYRGSRLTFDAAMATEAQCYRGEDAVKRGLADATGNPMDAFLAFVNAVNRN